MLRVEASTNEPPSIGMATAGQASKHGVTLQMYLSRAASIAAGVPAWQSFILLRY